MQQVLEEKIEAKEVTIKEKEIASKKEEAPVLEEEVIETKEKEISIDDEFSVGACVEEDNQENNTNERIIDVEDKESKESNDRIETEEESWRDMISRGKSFCRRFFHQLKLKETLWLINYITL